MPSPVVSDDFDNTSFTGSICDLFRQKLLNNDKMVLLLSYLFQDDGDIGSEFATDLMELLQPIGTIVPAPVDLSLDADAWLKCEGQAVSRTTYARLFAKLGTTFGSGDGSTTFNIPDLRDSFLIGASGTKTPGSTGGSATVTLGTEHIPDHDHLTAFHSATDLGAGDVRENDMVLPSLNDSALSAAVPVRYLHTSSTGGGPTTDNEYDTMNCKSLGVLSELAESTSGHDNIPPYMSMVMYLKANHKVGGIVL